MEWVIILAIVLLLFGPSRLPKLGKSLGKTVRSLREGLDGKLEEEDEAEKTDSSAKSKAADDEQDE